jgi:hypothetical protein
MDPLWFYKKMRETIAGLPQALGSLAIQNKEEEKESKSELPVSNTSQY